MSSEPFVERLLGLDDIRIGQYVTIYRWTTGDRSYVGDVLEVKAVSGPFVAVRNHSDKYERGLDTLDTRRCTLTPLRAEFVRAILGAEQSADEEASPLGVSVQSIQETVEAR